MANKVTIQDIADALGISRNTVSKAINNTGVLADATRDKILAKAQEMGYKTFSYANYAIEKPQGQMQLSQAASDKREIALFTTEFLNASHFASTMLDKFQREASSLGYSLTIYRILNEEVDSLALPVAFNRDKTAGIICFEVFNNEYASMIVDTNIPVLFVDSPVQCFGMKRTADFLYMENQYAIYEFIRLMKMQGKKTFGFVGNYMHCQSFFERFVAMKNGLYMNGLEFDEGYNITSYEEDKSKLDNLDKETIHILNISQALSKMKKLPEIFICANDFVASDLVNALKNQGYSCPEDVYILGFDDAPESKIITPNLSTVHIHSQIMGLTAVHLLATRIAEPSLNTRILHTETELILRASTGA